MKLPSFLWGLASFATLGSATPNPLPGSSTSPSKPFTSSHRIDISLQLTSLCVTRRSHTMPRPRSTTSSPPATTSRSSRPPPSPGPGSETARSSRTAPSSRTSCRPGTAACGPPTCTTLAVGSCSTTPSRRSGARTRRSASPRARRWSRGRGRTTARSSDPRTVPLSMPVRLRSPSGRGDVPSFLHPSPSPRLTWRCSCSRPEHYHRLRLPDEAHLRLVVGRHLPGQPRQHNPRDRGSPRHAPRRRQRSAG